jgi:hypothetical protein
MSQLLHSCSLAEARWRNRSRAGGVVRLLSRGGTLFAAQRRHECRLPVAPAQVRWRVAGRTTEFGQRVLVGLLMEDPWTARVTGPGLGIVIDPETGRVEDVVGEGGVVGYLESAPQGVGVAVELEVEAWLYGRTVIPRLRLNGETMALPAFLVRTGLVLTAMVGGELGSGAMLQIDDTELVLRPLAGDGVMNG